MIASDDMLSIWERIIPGVSGFVSLLLRMPTAIKLYKECVTWDSIVFLILGLALAFAGYKFWKVISSLFSCRSRNFAVRTCVAYCTVPCRLHAA